MKVLRVKDFKCYQPVRILNEYLTNFLDSDRHKIVSCNNHAFFLPEQGVICLKNQKDASERFIPLSNIQDFTLMEELMKKNIEVKVPDSELKEGPKTKKVKDA